MCIECIFTKKQHEHTEHREHYTNTCSLYTDSDSIHTLTQHSKAFLNWPFKGMKRSRILNFKGLLTNRKRSKMD